MWCAVVITNSSPIGHGEIAAKNPAIEFYHLAHNGTTVAIEMLKKSIDAEHQLF
jgi:hypothetical protein